MTADKDPLSRDDLLAPFFDAQSPRDAWRLGSEAEKFGVRIADGAPLQYEGEIGVRTILERLEARFGWRPMYEYEGGPILGLKREGASITLEPGGQLELSGAPLVSAHAWADEIATHHDELEAVSSDLDVAWLGLGHHPFARQSDLPWVPKMRYGVMREYLPTRGARALDMMRRTATVQTNLDFSDERDALRKLRVALAVQPIVTAMFANGPFYEGDFSVDRTLRGRVWLHMDPDRSGLLPFLWKHGVGYGDYVDWALDVPMFIVKRGERMLRATHLSFRSFLRDGLEGTEATSDDWETHLNTLFPEARLKRTLEVRGGDSQSEALAVALTAFWKGLLYDDAALAQAEGIVSRWDPHQVEAARDGIAREALRAPIAGRSTAEWAAEFVGLARDGLERAGVTDAAGEDETKYLAPLRAGVDIAEAPADRVERAVRDAMARGASFHEAVIAAACIRPE